MDGGCDGGIELPVGGTWAVSEALADHHEGWRDSDRDTAAAVLAVCNDNCVVVGSAASATTAARPSTRSRLRGSRSDFTAMALGGLGQWLHRYPFAMRWAWQIWQR